MGGTREEHRRKNRPKEKETPLLPALKTKSQKTEKWGGLESLKLAFLSAAELKVSYTAKEL